MHNKCNALESSPNHPPPWSVEKLSSTKPVPGAKKAGDHWHKCLLRFGLWHLLTCIGSPWFPQLLPQLIRERFPSVYTSVSLPSTMEGETTFPVGSPKATPRDQNVIQHLPLRRDMFLLLFWYLEKRQAHLLRYQVIHFSSWRDFLDSFLLVILYQPQPDYYICRFCLPNVLSSSSPWRWSASF